MQATVDKSIAIYSADKGRKLWEMKVDQGGHAAAITYMIDGVQYIAINASWNGSPAYTLPRDFRYATAKLLVFRLDAKGVILPPMKAQTEQAWLPTERVPAETFKRGAELFAQSCNRCHGDNAIGGIKDLRKMGKAAHDGFLDIVLNGARTEKGMPGFGSALTEAQAKDIHGYLITRAQEDW